MTWFETREIRWDEIADFDVRATSPRNSKYRLRGENGSVLVVQPGYTGKKATEFEEILVAKLAPALRKKREGILHRGKIYFPQRGLNFYANLGNGAVFVLVSFSLLSPSDWIRDHPLAFLGMTLSAAAYCFADAYFLYRQELRIGKETLEKRTLRSRVVIKLNEITAITQTPQKGYIVHSGATQIPLNASMPDFQFVLEYLSQYATPPMPPKDPAKLKTRGSNNLQLGFVFLILLCIASSIGFMGVTALQTERLLDRQSQPVNGRITQLAQSRVYYSFTALNVEYDGESSIVPKEAKALQIGNPIRVEYLPDNPQVSRVTISNRRGRAIGMLLIVAINSVVFAALIASKFKKKPTKS